MKKFLSYTMLLACLAGSCQTLEEDAHPTIVGQWVQASGPTENPDFSYKNEIIFFDNQQYERSLQIVDTQNTQNIIGYLNLTKGKYALEGNRLHRFQVQYFNRVNGEEFLDRGDLIFEHESDVLPGIGVFLNNTENELTLDYQRDNTCPDLAMCISSETFFRSL